MRRRLFIWVIVFIVSTICTAETDLEYVEEFLHVVFKSEGATLSDYYRLAGQGAESERQILFAICTQKEWIPPEKHQACLQFIHNREVFPEKTPSLYLRWLSSKLPKSPTVQIKEVTHYEGTFHYDVITTQFDDVTMTFFRTRDAEKIQEFGIINIAEINGVSVLELLVKDLKDPNINWLFKQ